MVNKQGMSSSSGEDLGALFHKYGSDKDRNGYSPLYSILFTPQRHQPVRLLEVGIGTMIPDVHSSMVGYALPHYRPGGSLRAWRDFFEKGSIFGMDVQKDTQITDEERISTFICDSTDANHVRSTIPFEEVFDIIIDDGSHYFEHQISTLKNLYPLLKQGGIYIIEDCVENTPLNTDRQVLRNILGHDTFFFVGFQNNQCVIRKPVTRLPYPG